jgi:hypothetical protein
MVVVSPIIITSRNGTKKCMFIILYLTWNKSTEVMVTQQTLKRFEFISYVLERLLRYQDASLMIPRHVNNQSPQQRRASEHKSHLPLPSKARV